MINYAFTENLKCKSTTNTIYLFCLVAILSSKFIDLFVFDTINNVKNMDR